MLGSTYGLPISQIDSSNLMKELDQLRAAMTIPDTDDDLLSNNAAYAPSEIFTTSYRINSIGSQYNRLMDQISSPFPGPRSDPLDTFPQEIWERVIFEAAFTENMPHDVEVTTVDYILPLTLVSTCWANAIIGNPRFWTTIELKHGIHDLEAKICTSLSLSRGMPLTIVISYGLLNTILWEKFGHYVVSQRTRIRAIFMYLNGSPDRIFHDIGIGNTPLLRTLHVRGADEECEALLNFIMAANSISTLTGQVFLSTKALQSFPRIRTVYITSRPGEPVLSLEPLSNLEDIFYLVAKEDLSYWHSAGYNPLPWKSLRINHGFDGCGEYILPRAAATLVHLKIQMIWDRISNLLLACNNMPLLRSLCIQISSPSIEPKPPGRLALSPSSISKLDIEIHSSSEGEPYVVDLFDNLMVMAPKVRDLRFYSASPSLDLLLRYACSLQPLQCLTLPFNNPFGSGFAERHEPGFEDDYLLQTDRLVVSYGTFQSLIRTRGVKSLTIRRNLDSKSIFQRFRAPSPMGPTHAPIKSEWDNLHTLKFELGRKQIAGSWDWEGIGFSLPRVTNIEFMESDSFQSSSGFTALCQEIAVNPYSFPSLEVIKGGIPEWDILFIMLERRNFLQLSVQPPTDPSHGSVPIFTRSGPKEESGNEKGTNVNVSRIKELRFSATPGIRVLKPLTSLLGGRFSVRPSNYDASLAGITEAYLDSITSGCFQCHALFQHCQRVVPWKQKLFEGKTYPNAKKQNSVAKNFKDAYQLRYRNLFEYPDSISMHDIFLERLRRFEAWERILQDLGEGKGITEKDIGFGVADDNSDDDEHNEREGMEEEAETVKEEGVCASEYPRSIAITEYTLHAFLSSSGSFNAHESAPSIVISASIADTFLYTMSSNGLK